MRIKKNTHSKERLHTKALKLPMKNNLFWGMFNRGKNGVPRAKARTEKGDEYPDRFDVSEEKAPWNKKLSGYKPEYYVAPAVIQNDETKKPEGYVGKEYWAHPEDISQLESGQIKSYEPLQFDEKGYPLNPRGRTGIKGRGLLGKWGANFAADNIITRPSADGEGVEVFIKPREDGQFAFPAGMVDYGETVAIAAKRELLEETGVELDIATGGSVVYQGYVDDPRNTDNAWMESTFFHKHFSREETGAVEGQDTETSRAEGGLARWVKVTPELKMYASHRKMLDLALAKN
jgi:ADP-ribose pyrophosphatase